MRVETNWALFVQERDIKWAFGNPDEEFQTFVVNFLTGLSNIGQEVLGQHGVADIIFEVQKHSGSYTSEIFIVSLMNKFFLIMSDPTMTLKLIEIKGNLSIEIQDMMAAVLVGQAAVLYAQSISEVDATERKAIETIWQSLLLDFCNKNKTDVDTIVGGDSSNFSQLTFHELIYLHYYLRQQPKLVKALTPRKWAIGGHLTGGEVPLAFNITQDSLVLAGYLAVINSFLMTFFNAKPQYLIFGTTDIQRLCFINGMEYFLAIDAPFTELTEEPQFLETYFALPAKVLSDLNKGVQKQVVEEILQAKGVELLEMELKELLYLYVTDNPIVAPTQKKAKHKKAAV